MGRLSLYEPSQACHRSVFHRRPCSERHDRRPGTRASCLVCWPLNSAPWLVIGVHGVIDRQEPPAHCVQRVLVVPPGEPGTADVAGEGTQLLVVDRLGDLTIELRCWGLGRGAVLRSSRATALVTDWTLAEIVST